MMTNLFSKKVYLLLFLLTTFNSFSQINYEAGYFIDNQGAKTECLIKNVAWNKNPTEFEYKLNENEPVKKAIITDIKEFSVGNSYKFLRFDTKIDRSGSNVNALNTGKQPVWSQEILFLKVLVEGDVNLYQYESGGSNKYFLSTGTHDKAEQLVYKEYYDENNHDGYSISENNNFRQQLWEALKSSDQFKQSDFFKLTYKRTELIELISKFNTSKGVKTTNYEVSQNQNSLDFKIIAGVNQSSFTFNNIARYSNYNEDLKLDSKPVFRIGIELENIFSFNQKKWSVFIAPNYQSYKAEGKTNTNLFIATSYKFIEIPLGIRYYMFVGKKSRVFMNLGLSLELRLNSLISYEKSTLIPSKSSSGYMAGIGYSNGTYGLELRYNSNRNILNNYLDWKSDYKSVGIVASCKLF
jgi:hypothetical protein